VQVVVSEKEVKMIKLGAGLVISLFGGYGISGFQQNDTLKTYVESQKLTDEKQNELIKVLNDRSLRNDERQKAIFVILKEIKEELKRKN
jgi:hypothetical protein|tara:strand:- start:1146 stop:1412 length:267 start_codon:yes stop_codon:yes gene_type:complete